MSTAQSLPAGQELYVPEVATVTAAKQMTALERWLEIELAGGRDLSHRPMQFVEVSLFGIGEAPYSVCSSPTKCGRFEICVRKVGAVSAALQKLGPGDKVGIRGPLGNGIDPAELEGKDVLVIAGGIGLVPVRSLINYVIDRRGDFGRLTILYGCKTPGELLYTNELEKWRRATDIDLRVTVDRGDEHWAGHTGVITTLMPDLEIDAARSKVVIVGPPIMFKFVLLALAPKQLSSHDVYMSLERRMKCGVGKCGHCQINNLYVCQSGPVFTYAQIKHLEEAL